MDQPAPEAQPAPRKDPRGSGPRSPRPRLQPNRLRAWLERDPPPMTKQRFAQLIGVTKAYISMLVADGAPWPNREIARRIAIVTEGEVRPDDLAGYPPED